MAFNLNNFKSDINDQGVLKQNSYDVYIGMPLIPVGNGSIDSSRKLKIRTESAAIPGSSFSSVDNYRPYGFGKTYNIPYSYIPQEISCTHLVDRDGDMYKIITDWMNNIVDYQGRRETVGGNHYSAYYLDEYKGSMSIYVYSPIGDLVKRVELKEVYPISLDQIQMSWSASNEIVRINVNYRYTHYEVLEK